MGNFYYGKFLRWNFDSVDLSWNYARNKNIKMFLCYFLLAVYSHKITCQLSKKKSQRKFTVYLNSSHNDIERYVLKSGVIFQFYIWTRVIIWKFCISNFYPTIYKCILVYVLKIGYNKFFKFRLHYSFNTYQFRVMIFFLHKFKLRQEIRNATNIYSFFFNIL